MAASLPVAAQAPRSPVTDALRTRIDAGDQKAEDDFWSRLTHGPLIEPLADEPDRHLVTFLYRGSGEERGVVLQSNAATVLMPGATGARLDRISSRSDTWYLTMPAPSDLRTTYAFRVVDADGRGRSIADPINPDSVWTSSGSRVSALTLPWAPEEPCIPTAGEPSGSWVADTLQSGPEGNAQEVWVHVPPGYNPTRTEAYPVVVALNRYNFRYAIPTAGIVDCLVERAVIPPVVLAVADELESDGAGYASSAAWIADGLVPWLRDRYRVSGQAGDVVIAGASRRGLVAAAVALDRPDAIGNALSLSGAFYWRPDPGARFEWLAARYAERVAVPVRFYLAVGTLETVITADNQGHYPLATSRHFGDVLRAREYDYRLEEFTGTHDELNWRVWLARGLIHLLGTSTR